MKRIIKVILGISQGKLCYFSLNFKIAQMINATVIYLQ